MRFRFLRRNLAGLLLLTVGLAGPLPVRAEVDAVLREAIENQARQDQRLSGAQVIVHVHKRDVILSGKVRLYLQKMIYEQIAWHTEGVREVGNEIRVVPETPKTDDEIKAIIIHFLVEHERLRGTGLAIEVHKGHVFLSGTFHEPEAVFTLKHRVAQIEGVVAIEIDVKVLAAHIEEVTK
jgi:osmotically-inducible protein OsmY